MIGYCDAPYPKYNPIEIIVLLIFLNFILGKIPLGPQYIGGKGNILKQSLQ